MLTDLRHHDAPGAATGKPAAGAPKAAPASRWPRASLRTYLVALTLLATVPLAVLTSVQIFGGIQAERARLNSNLLRVAASLSRSVERELSASLETLTMLSFAPSLRQGDVAGFQRALRSQPLLPANWTGVFLLRADGATVFDSRPAPHPEIEAGAARRVLAEDRPLVSGLQGAPGQGGRFVALLVPVVIDAEARYVLGAAIAPALWQKLVESSGAPDGGFAAIFDAERRIIARSLEPERFVGAALPPAAVAAMGGQASGLQRAPMLGGGDLYGAWDTVEPGGWGVAVNMPAGPLERSDALTVLAILGTAAGCMLLGVSCALLIARRITEPLRQLSLYGAGRPPVRSPVAEIGRLRGAMLVAAVERAAGSERLQRKAEEFENLFHSSPLGLAFAQDTECRAVLQNAAMSELLPQAADAQAGLARLLHRGRPLAPRELPLCRAASDGEITAAMELEVQHPGRPARFILASAVPLWDGAGQPRGAIGAVVDITERKRAEALLISADRRLHEMLEHEQAARREAEAANRAKDEFLAMLGHELRNPLSAIASASEVLGRVDGNAQVAVNARNIISRQTRNLARMTNDLLDVARVLSGKPQLSRQPVNLAALVRRVVATVDLSGALRQHCVELQLADEVWVQADSTRIEQAVGNLLANAARYTPPGGKVEIELRKVAGPQAELQVRDTGPGIPAELLPRIFDLFVQGERALDRPAGGLGVGLTLVKRLVELHGGSVEARSAPGAGSVFTLRLPALDGPPAACAPQAAPGLEPRPRRVVVVDDNADALSGLRAMLELDGHAVETAADGETGLALLLAQSGPEVAVVDIGLPGISGYELAQRARAGGYGGHLIALTGYGQGRDLRRSMDAGFDAHLVKPVDAEKLRQQLAVA